MTRLRMELWLLLWDAANRVRDAVDYRYARSLNAYYRQAHPLTGGESEPILEDAPDNS